MHAYRKCVQKDACKISGLFWIFCFVICNFLFFSHLSFAAVISNTSNVTIRVVLDPTFNLGGLIGKVFNDQNENSLQDKGEAGIPNVKVATEEGVAVITDEYGRFHIPDVYPGRHLIKIDTATLPAGAKVTTDKVRLFKTTDAVLNKINFGVKLPADYKIDLEKPLSILVSQNYSPPHKILGLNLEEKEIQKKAQQIIKVNTNYHKFIMAWQLEIKNQKDDLIKSLDGKNTVPEEFNPDEFKLDPSLKVGKVYPSGLDLGEYKLFFNLFDTKGKKDTFEYVLEVIKPQSKLEEKPVFNLSFVSKKEEIMIKGATVKLNGETQTANELTIFGREVKINKDGSYNAEFILPFGAQEIPIELKEPNEKIYKYTQKVNLAENYVFFVGLAEEEFGKLDYQGKLESVPAQDKDRLEKKYYLDGKLAYYLKAKIKGKYLITSSLDTTRARKELFRNIEPDDYYPIYGDASKIEYDATDTQDEFYLLIEAEKSYAKWGNFGTGITGTELGSYDRTLHGAKIHYQSLATSPNGNPNTLVTIFGAQIRQLGAHNELRATGGSLYYLKNKDIIMGSEKVVIEVRDELSGITLERKEQAAGKDYEIDYDQARLLFYQPAHSVSYASSSITSNNLLDGNPVYLVVDYEYKSSSIFKDHTLGLRGSQQVLENLRLGGTYIAEERDAKNYNLRGIDSTLDLPLKTKIDLEYAESTQEATRNDYSSDGGLSFSKISTPSASEYANAYKVAIKSQPTENTQASGYFKKISKDFSNVGSSSQEGTQKTGLAVSQGLTKNTTLKVTQDIQKLLDGGNEQSSSLGAAKVTTTIAQLNYKKDKVGLIGEYRGEKKDGLSDSRSDSRADLLAGQINYDLNKNTDVFLGAQGSARGQDNHQLRAGFNTRVDDKTAFRVTQAVGNQGDATILGIEKRVDDQTSLYTNYTFEPDAKIISTGTRSKITDQASIYTEDEFKDYSGNRQLGNVYGLNYKISNKLSGDFSFERSKIQNSTVDTVSEAGKLGLDYIDVGFLKISSDFELKFDDSANDRRQFINTDSAELHLTKDISFLTRLEYSLTKNTATDLIDARFSEFQSGLAYRPVKFDRMNLLAEYKRFEDLPPTSQEDINGTSQSIKTIYSLEGAFDLLPHWTLVEKFARRDIEEKTSGSLVPSQTYLLISRLNFHLTKEWDLIAEHRFLRQRQNDDRKQGALFEVDRSIGEFVKVGVGYNFADFETDISASSGYTTYGPYLRLTGTLGDLTPEELEYRRQLILEVKKKRNIGIILEGLLALDNRLLLKQLNEKITQAGQYYQRGYFIEAGKLYDEVVIEINNLKLQAGSIADRQIEKEENTYALNTQARALLKEGNYQEAIRTWQAVIKNIEKF